MKFKIHFEIGDYEDWLIIEGDNIEECQENAKIETDRRGLTEDKNNLWSEELK